MFLHQRRRALWFSCTDRVHDLPMLVIVPEYRLTIQGRFAHAFPLVMVTNQVHPGHQPDQEGVPCRLRKGFMELPVSFGKRDRIVQVFVHVGKQILQRIELGPAAVEDDEPANVRLERKSCVDQFQRTCVGEELVCRDRRFQVCVRNVGSTAAAGLHQSLVLQVDDRLPNRAPRDPVDACEFPFGRQSVVTATGPVKDLTPE